MKKFTSFNLLILLILIQTSSCSRNLVNQKLLFLDSAEFYLNAINGHYCFPSDYISVDSAQQIYMKKRLDAFIPPYDDDYILIKAELVVLLDTLSKFDSAYPIQLKSFLADNSLHIRNQIKILKSKQ